MAKINVRKETGKLFIDFRYRNVRCREQADLTDTPSNRRKLKGLVDRIEAEILLGTFDYATFFPNSTMLKKIESVEGALRSDQSGGVRATHQTFLCCTLSARLTVRRDLIMLLNLTNIRDIVLTFRNDIKPLQ
ncbi:hypothetical protein HMF8227_02878 [Saliniradius amylolyticus]|uniref:Min27-like integrase DNA-binding domain-containing protein n=1 Tax=Saliniradius amylolyticus TaxID=2183582 RepID=A0A2S2E6P0_9ALTE|nr:DUF3596 domain-containing protein [Saliniradius amylolyticus]AWL13326.1 hypothetical protein HMF8227_02878 [Saliniradius amylolyticus]